jgi:peptidyl-tRNA hydrolase
MPVFMIERRYADLMQPTPDEAAAVNAINAEEDVRWLMSFLSSDQRKSYCLYEAESPDSLVRAAERAGLPADVITELGHRVLPDGSFVTVAD